MTETTQDRPKRQNRQYVVELEEQGGHPLAYTLGALGGLAVAALLARGFEALAGRDASTRIRQSGGGAPAAYRPGRLRRPTREQDELLSLEDEVLDAFLRDEVLCECGIDVGAISRGMIELSGSVWTREQSQRAAWIAQGVPGVETVVNRMEVEDERERLHPRERTEEGVGMSAEWTGHRSGMGRRRQGDETDPARPDESHRMREDALEQADRSQFADEGHHSRPRLGDVHEGEAPNPTDYDEDELDNQSPYGKHAVSVPEQPRALHSQARVGEGLKPGVELELESADVPVKPHGHPSTGR